MNSLQRVACDQWFAAGDSASHRRGRKGVYEEDSPSVLVAWYGLGQTHPAQYSHPWLDRAGTNLSYCNGEIRVASSNITPYIVWAWIRPRCIAHTLRHLDIWQRGDEDRRWENRESTSSLAQALEKCKWLAGSGCEIRPESGVQTRNQMQGAVCVSESDCVCSGEQEQRPAGRCSFLDQRSCRPPIACSQPPNFSKKRQIVSIPRWKLGMWNFSFGACRLSSGSPKPIITLGILSTS